MFPKDLWAHLQNECNVYCHFYFFCCLLSFFFQYNNYRTCIFFGPVVCKKQNRKNARVHSVLLELLTFLIRVILTLFEDVETITTIASLYSPL